MSLGYRCGLEPFDIGYAYEALARATSLAGNPQRAAEYLSPAGELHSLSVSFGVLAERLL